MKEMPCAVIRVELKIMPRRSNHIPMTAAMCIK
jgi:hypothetical protein